MVEEVRVDTQQTKVEIRVCDRRIWLEDGCQSAKCDAHKERVLSDDVSNQPNMYERDLQLDTQWHNIDEQVELKDAEEEGSKVLKHFRKEVPPESYVWCEIRHQY